MRSKAGPIALGGVLSALALVIMCLGGLIPVMTYVCPMLCLVLLSVVHQQCGTRIAWAWYGATAILALLMAPDKEAAMLLTFLGYYPILKPRLDAIRPAALAWVIKLVLMSISVGAAYALLIWVLGMDEIVADFKGAGILMAAAMWVMALLCLIGLDVVLGRLRFRKR